MALLDRLERALPSGLRRRLILLVLASVAPFLLMIGIVARNQAVDYRPLVADRASSRSTEIARDLDALMRDIRSTAYAIIYALSADPARRAANDRILKSLAAETPGDITSWSVIGAGGALIGSSGQRQSVSDIEHIHLLTRSASHRAPGRVSEPASMSAGRAVHVVFPLGDFRGDSAYLVGQIPLHGLRPFLTARDLPAGTSIAIITESGIIAGRSPDPERWVGFDISGTPLDSVARSLRSNTAEFMTQDSVSRLLAVSRMTAARWLVGVGVPTRAIRAQARSDLAKVLAYGGAALILALLLALWQASRIVDPITRLSADAVKLGTGNLAHRSGVLGRDELGDLARTINEMATTLEQQGVVLRESEERYRGLFDINPLPMWVLDPESLDFLAVNRAAVDAYGYSEAEFLGMKVSDIRLEEDVPARRSRLTEVGKYARRYVTRHQRKDGTLFPVEIDSGSLTFSGREARLVIARDISERIHAEEALRDAESQLRQSQRLEAVGQLTGGIAHDFNNVLTAIGSYSDFLYDSLDPGDARRLDIQEIRKAADRAAGLTKQLLAFSRSQILQPRVLDVNESVTELEPLLRRVLTADLDLVLALDPEAGRVRADPGQFAQVLINLAVNARDAMPNAGVLTISSRNERGAAPARSAGAGVDVRPGDYVVMDVSDTGMGMDAQTLQRIFEPFFTTKGPGKGTGLGLSTVYGIVHQSGGYISAESVVGRGTTFTIRLPRVDEPVEPEQPKLPESAVAGQRSEIILVVEDEESVRRATRRILIKKGYTVLEASDGNEALQVMQSHPKIDLLLTDLVMPGMGGRELVRVLRSEGRAIATLYMSGYTKDAVMRSELDPDIMVLEKPFSQAELATKVREALDKSGNT